MTEEMKRQYARMWKEGKVWWSESERPGCRIMVVKGEDGSKYKRLPEDIYRELKGMVKSL